MLSPPKPLAQSFEFNRLLNSYPKFMRLFIPAAPHYLQMDLSNTLPHGVIPTIESRSCFSFLKLQSLKSALFKNDSSSFPGT